MCNWFSCIYTKEGNILHVDGFHHETIIEKYNLKDNISDVNKRDFVRVEILKDKEVKIDEDEIPNWFKDRYLDRILSWYETNYCEICLEAVKQNVHVLQYIKKQTPKLCLEAVKQHVYALQYVNDEFRKLF